MPLAQRWYRRGRKSEGDTDFRFCRLVYRSQMFISARCERHCRSRGAIGEVRQIRVIRIPFALRPGQAGLHDQESLGITDCADYADCTVAPRGAKGLPCDEPGRTFFGTASVRFSMPALGTERGAGSQLVDAAKAARDSPSRRRRNTPAEISAISSPTGSGSRKVIAELKSGFWYRSLNFCVSASFS